MILWRENNAAPLLRVRPSVHLNHLGQFLSLHQSAIIKDFISSFHQHAVALIVGCHLFWCQQTK